MNFKTYIATVINSEASDWLTLHRPVFLQEHEEIHGPEGQSIGINDHDQLFTLKSDLAISIACGMVHREKFQEPFVDKFPDRKASSEYVDLLWFGRPFMRQIRVLVDGARAGLPIPTARDLSVPRGKVAFFHLIDELGNGTEFARCFGEAGMTVTEDPWPE